MNLRVFHCGITFTIVNEETQKKERTHVCGHMLAADPEHCRVLATKLWKRGRLEWCDENTWEQAQDTGQKWLNVNL